MLWSQPAGPRRQYIDCGTATLSRCKYAETLTLPRRTLRYAITPRILWIDVIYISQSPMPFRLQEKEEQVQLMADSYRSAERALMWLGPGIGLISRALATLETLAGP